MRQHALGPIEEFPPGSRRIVELDGRSIGVFNVDGRLYALRNRCPHQGAPLCLGPVAPLVIAPCPGSYVAERTEVIRCPWHGWEFQLADGRSWVDPEGTRVRAYPVEVRGGQVLVQMR
jgi:3-phenylpropionate/trans-cinnamate dioxygenase ferredoxin subunit